MKQWIWLLFQIILESEMDKARDQKGVTGSEFTKQAHFDRPSSSASNKAVDVMLPFLLQGSLRNDLI